MASRPFGISHGTGCLFLEQVSFLPLLPIHPWQTHLSSLNQHGNIFQEERYDFSKGTTAHHKKRSADHH